MKKDKTNYALLFLNNESKIKLNKTKGSLETLNILTNNIIKVDFKRNSMIYKLLDGRDMLKDIYKKDRLVAVKIDEKLNATNATTLDNEELNYFENKYFKVTDFKWSLLFKGSFGI